MTTAPFEPGSDFSINPDGDPQTDSPDPVAPGAEPEADPAEPQPTES